MTSPGTNSKVPSLSSSLDSSIELISESPVEAIKSLTSLQKRVSSLHLFSKNETLEDVATSHIRLLSLEHHLALALIASPSTSGIERHVNVVRAVDLFHAFLRKLDSMDVLKPEVRKEYMHLLDKEDVENEEDENGTEGRLMYKSRNLGESFGKSSQASWYIFLLISCLISGLVSDGPFNIISSFFGSIGMQLL